MAQPEGKTDSKKPTKIFIRAVHGLMGHPYDHAVFNTDSITEVKEIDDWLKGQIEAGKLEVI